MTVIDVGRVLPPEVTDKLATFKAQINALSDNDLAERCSDLYNGFWAKVIRPVIPAEDLSGMDEWPMLVIFHLTEDIDGTLSTEAFGVLLHDHFPLLQEEG